MNENKVHSLNKAIDLLDLLSRESGGMKLGTIAERSGYPKSTVHTLLSTMRDRGVVAQQDDGRYTLGIRLFEYGAAVSRGFDIGRIARPYLERLASLTGANAVISVFDEGGVVAFDYAASAQGVQIMPEIGVRLPLHATSQGKLMLSTLPVSKAARLIGRCGLQPYTPHTVADRDDLLQRLDRIREDGYAVEDGEYKIGLRSVSAPVRVAGGEVRYTLTTIGFFRRASGEDFLTAVRHTVEQAERLSAALGWKG